MTKLLFLAAAVLAAVFGWLPFQGTDVAKLQPVELVCVTEEAGGVRIETDTQDTGVGKNVSSALEDLRESAAGEIFLETADKLLVAGSAMDRIPELYMYLRPGCSVYVLEGEAEITSAVKYLDARRASVTLSDYRAGAEKLPILRVEKGRMHIVWP